MFKFLFNFMPQRFDSRGLLRDSDSARCYLFEVTTSTGKTRRMRATADTINGGYRGVLQQLSNKGLTPMKIEYLRNYAASFYHE